MTELTVNGGCRSCRVPLRLPIKAFELVKVNGRTTMSFDCPACGAFEVRMASTVDLVNFYRQGLEPRRVELCPSLIAGERPTGQPITEDDLLAFGRALEALS